MATIILSHESARAYWASPWMRHEERSLGRDETAAALKDADAGLRHVLLKEVCAAAPLNQLDAPLSLLVTERARRRETKLARFRCMHLDALPKGSLVHAMRLELSDAAAPVDVLASSPAFCFLQLASGADMLGLAKLGFELCGEYAIDERASKGFVKRPAVTDAEQLSAFVDACPGLTGAKPARRIAQHVLDGAKTPDDAAIALAASLPRSLGGMGVPAPLLGQTLGLPEDAVRMMGTRELSPTLLWPGIATALEYDPRPGTAQTASNDYAQRKARAYERVGYELLSLTREDMGDIDALRACLERLARKLGKRRQPVNDRQAARQQETLAQLFG